VDYPLFLAVATQVVSGSFGLSYSVVFAVSQCPWNLPFHIAYYSTYFVEVNLTRRSKSSSSISASAPPRPRRPSE
jgi:hypothetical protein